MTQPELSDAVGKLARDFSRRELAPIVFECDESETFPEAAYKKLVPTGLHALGLPEEFGGGGSLRALATVAEELSRVDPGFVLSVLASSQLFGYNVARLGTP